MGIIAGTKTSDHIQVLHKLQKLNVYVAWERFVLVSSECLRFITLAVTVITDINVHFKIQERIFNVYFLCLSDSFRRHKMAQFTSVCLSIGFFLTLMLPNLRSEMLPINL